MILSDIRFHYMYVFLLLFLFLDFAEFPNSQKCFKIPEASFSQILLFIPTSVNNVRFEAITIRKSELFQNTLITTDQYSQIKEVLK